MTDNNVRERQREERKFYEVFYGDGWEKQDQRIEDNIVPPNMLVYWHLVKKHVGWLKSRQDKVCILDCGCGHGVLSVLLAKMNVFVTSVDISPRSIEITKHLAHVNGVEQNIHAQAVPLENLPFEDDCFDCIVGTRVLHHVDVTASGVHLARVLRSQGIGIFWECTERNLVLRFARKYIRRMIPLPKFGTQHEHPLTDEEIGTLETIFGRKAEIVAAPFYFFGFLDQYIFRERVPFLTKAVNGLDASIAKYLPFMNGYSFHQILILEKRAESDIASDIGPETA